MTTAFDVLSSAELGLAELSIKGVIGYYIGEGGESVERKGVGGMVLPRSLWLKGTKLSG